jgi:hypothetical protein
MVVINMIYYYGIAYLMCDNCVRNLDKIVSDDSPGVR